MDWERKIKNLPGFIAMCPGMPNVGPQLWSSAYLPSVYQGQYVPCHERAGEDDPTPVSTGGSAQRSSTVSWNW